MTASFPFQLTHLGGERCVTGSCHLVRAARLNLLVDCGAVQGQDQGIPMDRWPVPPSDIQYLLLTHAHIDHIGAVPELIRRGFRGEILATHATRALLLPMLRDAMSFSDMDEHESRRIAERIHELSWGFEYGEPFQLKNGLRFTFGRAGHLLGSASILLQSSDSGASILFSGDLGMRDTPLLPDPDPPPPCDFLVLESTYGDRLHENRTDRLARLGKILVRALADRGKVFIPAFALGRSQELLYELDRLVSDESLRRKMPELAALRRVPVFLDSPLGIELTRIASSLSEHWDREAKDLLAKGDHPLDFDNLYAATRHRDHLKLLELPGPAVILAGSGMCTGGRIVDHLKAGIEDARNDILFVGYQGHDTPGREIQESATRPGTSVVLDGERYTVRAKVHVLGGYSGHADRQGILEWVAAMPRKPGSIRLVHGEPEARRALWEALAHRGYGVA